MAIARPDIVARSEWGAPEAIQAPQYTKVTHIIVHHTAISRDDRDWPAFLRDIWQFHVETRGWDDVGYNYVIDPDGVIYEGRAGGDDVRGAHFICANENTMGVALVGDFEVAAPSEAAVESLVSLLAWKCDQRAIDPVGTTFHEGTQLWLRNISGHQDGNEAPAESGACPVGTVCPGRGLYELLPEIRERVRRETTEHSEHD
jgi:hypothetical protein